MTGRRYGTDGTSFALCHAGAARPRRGNASTRATGAAFERHARIFLERQGLVCVASNLSVRGAELDLVMRDRDGALVFVEVRARSRLAHGGAAASIGCAKRARLIRAALTVWAGEGGRCACRFDVIAFEAGKPVWIRDAFRADTDRAYI